MDRKLLGFMVWVIVAGMFLGCLLSCSNEKNDPINLTLSGQQAYYGICMAIVNADGIANEEEVKTMVNLCRHNGIDDKQLEEEANYYENTSKKYPHEYTQGMRETIMRGNLEFKKLLIENLTMLAEADGQFAAKEKQLIEGLKKEFGL